MEKGLLRSWPDQGPPVVWKKELGMSYAMPCISQGRLFLFDRERNRARLRVLGAETGEQLWSFDYPTDYRDQYGYNGGPRCCPIVDDNRVYLYGPEGMLHCLRVNDGKQIWSVDTGKNYGVVQNFFGVGSTPIIEKNLLLVQVGGSPPGSDTVPFDQLKGNGSALVAFDKHTGKEVFRSGNDLASYASPVVATIGDRRLALLFARSGLFAIDPRTGKEVFFHPWRAPLLESVNASNPVVVGNRIFITECYEFGSALLEVR
ncbi:MAG: PQQ-binding-like beta-propeller repeat protein, partial [Gemmataceae bacterium]